MLVKSINLANARLMDFYQVMSLVIGFLSKEDLVALNLALEAGAFKSAFDILEKAVKQAEKTGVTEEIIAADDERDNIYTGFTGTVRNMLRFPDAEIAQSAAKLLLITNKYGSSVTRLPQREETAVLKSMVSELKNAENNVLLQKTGLTMWVDKLDESNNKFEKLYVNRNKKEAELITGVSRTERTNTQSAFEKLVRAIEANAYLKGEAAYKPLADKINTEVANVQQAAKSRSTMNAKTKATGEV